MHVGTEQYFIEPVKGHSEDSGDNGHPHLVYRRTALQQQQQQQQQQPAINSNDVSMCGLENGGECSAMLCFLRATAYAVSAHMLSQFRPSVCLSVCPSVTRVDQSKTVEVRIMQFSPYSSPIPPVFAR